MARLAKPKVDRGWKPGPKPIIGDSKVQGVRLPEATFAILEEQQLKGGYDSLSSYLAAVICTAHHLDVPAYVTDRRHTSAPESDLFADLDTREVA